VGKKSAKWFNRLLKVDRYYLEINSLKNLNQVESPDQRLILEKVTHPDIELNKFFYKNIGKNHRWTDRLVWDNLKWASYLENKNVQTYILKLNKNLVGYFELIQDIQSNSSEIAYFGILDEYIGKKIGGYFLTEIIKICFKLKSERVWVHTCTFDHKNALNNYLKRGMKIFKKETINII
tara:strand:+ start:2693 stop:3229 length:537 start_codon:yes stop_codon:yes gene_type:complete